MPPQNPNSFNPIPLVTAVPSVPLWKRKIVLIPGAIFALLLALFIFIQANDDTAAPLPVVASSNAVADTTVETSTTTQYLVFQLFTDVKLSSELGNNFPPLEATVKSTVEDIVRAAGTVGTAKNKLGFVVGPISFDQTDAQVRSRISESFTIALANNVAVGFHIDDSMFWGRLSKFNSIENIEWLDWNKTPNTGRRVDWSATPTKIKPQLCINSPAVVAEIKQRAALIGEEVKRGMATLQAAGKPELFAGVIAGWETQIGKDFETGKSLGYCALTNKGYSAARPPADIDQARVDITKEFIDLWTASLASAGVPDTKIFSHIAVMPQITDAAEAKTRTHLESINFTPTSVAFGPHHYPGFSTYPGTGHREQIKAERAKNGNPPWISGEGTSLDPALAELGDAGEPMEPYLASFFNDGAVMVNVFGWGMGPKDNAFRRAAENESAIAAYKKFLSGAVLSEVVSGTGKLSLPERVQKIQSILPEWLPKHEDKKSIVVSLMSQLDASLTSGDVKTADSIADEVLGIIGE